ncbi:MAG: hypothetical protein M5U34_36910 [Chloroflexi bacterium]|nr:hypothetical protein [Chloroflexota bacterium]
MPRWEVVWERPRFVGAAGESMILCVNLNAAIDKTIVVNGFQGRRYSPTGNGAPLA